ncbi:hypothetical protein [Haloarcula sp. CBA1127]|uniref:hypothetical protein n=1 Tax=Haloarcula sp. CBA1127 TaxID=1765055 RepID=UPI00073E57B1|nr:hypothetical protein [Haloarcula sp. CBA1127]
MSSESHLTPTYPTEEQYERWEQEADELGMSMSEFVECMVEAGMKKFETSVTPDETNQELRKQRNDLKEELEHARNRIDRLENELHHGERGAIHDFVRRNPGATYNEIVQHVIDTAAGRVTSCLEGLEGEGLQVKTDEDGTDLYYPANGGSE